MYRMVLFVTSRYSATLLGIPQVSDIGKQVNRKLLEMIGAIYSPEIKLESRLKEDFATLARYLTISPSNQADIDLLGLGHLNILYIAMKLVEFEVNRNRELWLCLPAAVVGTVICNYKTNSFHLFPP